MWFAKNFLEENLVIGQRCLKLVVVKLWGHVFLIKRVRLQTQIQAAIAIRAPKSDALYQEAIFMSIAQEQFYNLQQEMECLVKLTN